MTNNRRSGFTLVELMVVIGILLVMAGLAFAVFNAGKSSDKMRSGARIAQSAFLGAKDRALHAKDLRGVRLTRDQTNPNMPNPNLVNGFVYLQSLGMLTYPTGSVSLERQDFNNDGFADTAAILNVHGFDGSEANYVPNMPTVDWNSKSQFFPYPLIVRIPAGNGTWYQFSIAGNNRYSLAKGNEYLQLGTAYPSTTGAIPAPSIVAYPQASTFSSCDIQLGNDVLPFHQPITLPSGCVIDLRWSKIPPTWTQAISIPQSPLNQYQMQGWASTGPDPSNAANVLIIPPMDVMFSPRGNVTGTISGYGSMFFLLRDMRDATNNLDPTLLANQALLQGDMLILAVFPQTGLVQTFETDLTDTDTNGTADNLFGLAQRGMSAGR